MRQIITLSFLFLLAFTASAQQWEPFFSPTEPSYQQKLVNIQQNLFISYQDGVYSSSDGGDHWQKVFHNIPADIQDPVVLDVNHQKGRIYFARTTDTSGWYGLHTSSDLGNTWSHIGSTSLGRLVFIGDTLYSVWHHQTANWLLSKKLNTGPWQLIPSFPNDTAGIVRTYAAEGEHLWVLAGKGLYHSSDAGYHWELSLPLNNLPPLSGNPGKTVCVEALHNEVVVLNEHAAKLYYTKDFGANWEEIPWGYRTLSNSGEHLYCIDLAGRDLLRFEGGNAANWSNTGLSSARDIVLDGTGGYEGTAWLLSQYYGIMRKRPDDATWQMSNGDLSLYKGESIYYWDNHLLTSTRAQSFSSDNGVSWKQNLFNYPSGTVWRNGNYSYFSSRTGVLRCPDNQRFEWRNHASYPSRISSVAVMGDTILALSDPPPGSLSYFRSLDNGSTWETFPAQYDVPIVGNKGKFYFVRQKSLHRSDDLGSSWPVVHTLPISGTVTRLLIVHDTLFIPYLTDDLIFYSTDEGQTFDTLAAPQNPNTSVFRLRVFGDLMMLNMDDGLAHLSLNTGKTWTSIPCESGSAFLYGLINSTFAFGNNTLFLTSARLRLDNQRLASGKGFLDLNG